MGSSDSGVVEHHNPKVEPHSPKNVRISSIYNLIEIW